MYVLRQIRKTTKKKHPCDVGKKYEEMCSPFNAVPQNPEEKGTNERNTQQK